MDSAIEIERKYDVVEGAVMPTPEGFGADPDHAVQLEAVYWDTTDAALAHAAIALRRREGGHDAGWHLKLPAALGREEVTAPLSTGEGTDAPPAGLLARVEAVIGGRPLAELAVLSTRRVIRVLRLDGLAVIELADDAVAARDARAGTERRWREWEAELLPGAASAGDALLDRVDAAFADAGARPSSSMSKLARALGRDRL